MNEPMEVHSRDCLDTPPRPHHEPNGYNDVCRCPCHKKYHVLEGQVHYYIRHVPAHDEWVVVDMS